MVYSNGAFVVINPDPSRGQFSSLQVGLREVLSRGRDAAMITLVDRPPVPTATIEGLRDSFISATQRWKWAVIPEYKGKHGHPIVAGRELMEAFLKADSTAIARDIEHEHQDKIEYVEVGDPLVAALIRGGPSSRILGRFLRWAARPTKGLPMRLSD